MLRPIPQLPLSLSLVTVALSYSTNHTHLNYMDSTSHHNILCENLITLESRAPQIYPTTSNPRRRVTFGSWHGRDFDERDIRGNSRSTSRRSRERPGGINCRLPFSAFPLLVFARDTRCAAGERKKEVVSLERGIRYYVRKSTSGI